MSYTVLHWITLCFLWGGMAMSMVETVRARRVRRRYEQSRELWDYHRRGLAEKTGLSLLQVDVALDAANTCFNQRVAELMATNRG